MKEIEPEYLRNASYPKPEPHRVLRQDDNGNVFEVRRLRSRQAAECLALTLEERGHKQHYWVEPIAEP